MVNSLRSILNKVLIVCNLSISLTSICENVRQQCYLAYTDGSHKSAEVLEGSPTIVPINFTGVVTVEAAYIPGYKAQWEYIRFMQNKDLEPLVVQFFTPTDEYTSSVSIFGEDKIGPYPDSEYEVYSLFDDVSKDIIIQVSDVHVAEDNFYRIYLGEPGNAHSRNYNYQNQENWEDLSFMRFNTTTQIKTDNRAIFFKSVSVCSDDSPVLCGDSVETVAVSSGDTFNLSCSVYGAPYLESVWSNVTAGEISEQPVDSREGFQHSSVISVENFTGNHAGEWKCYWRNKNLKTVSATKTFHVVELISRPELRTFVIPLKEKQTNRTLEWEIKKSPCFKSNQNCDTKLDCKAGETGMEQNCVKSQKNLTISETLTLPEEVKSDNITCSLYLVTNSGEKLGVLDTTTLYREGYHCEEGYYGVGEECLVCPENLTSTPRSTECFPSRDIHSDANFPRSDSGSDILVIITPVVAVLLLIIVILVVVFTIRMRRSGEHESSKGGRFLNRYSNVPSSSTNQSNESSKL